MASPAPAPIGPRQVWWVLVLFIIPKAVLWGWLAVSTERGFANDLFQWDGGRYLEIAQSGYQYPTYDATGTEINSNLAFFPLFPLLGRAVALLPGVPDAVALLAVAVLGSVAAAWGLFALGTRLAHRGVGIALALIWGLLPRSFLQAMPYSEGPFTAFTAWSLLALTQRRYWLAALLCALAGLTRPTGAATLAAVGGYLLVLLALSIIPRCRDRIRTSRWTIIGAGLTAASGLALGFLHVIWRTGNWDGYARVQRQWNLQLGPLSTTWHSWRHYSTTTMPPGYETVTAVAWTLPFWTAMALAIVLIACARPAWWPTAVHALVMWLMMAATQTYFQSRERYLLPAFGLVVPVAMAVAAGWGWRPLNNSHGQLLVRSLLVVAWVAATVGSAWWGVELLTTSKISP